MFALLATVLEMFLTVTKSGYDTGGNDFSLLLRCQRKKDGQTDKKEGRKKGQSY